MRVPVAHQRCGQNCLPNKDDDDALALLPHNKLVKPRRDRVEQSELLEGVEEAACGEMRARGPFHGQTSV